MLKNLKMITKPLMVLLILSLLICFCYACGGKYDDAVQVNEDFIEIMEEYGTDIENAKNAEEIIVAMDKFAEGVDKLAPRMKAIKEKYPDLGTKQDLPEELKASQKEMAKVGTKMTRSFMKIAEYMTNPDVLAAQMRIGQVMQSLSM